MTQIPEPSPASPPAVFEPPVVPPVHPAVPSVTPVPPPAKRRWPWAFLLVLVVIFYLGLKANSILDSLKPSNLLAVQRNETSIMTVLRSDELLFLVTDRIITRVDVEIVESAPWAGGRQGVLMATVKLYYGVDLEKIKPEMITEEKDRVIVRVPYPKLLDYSMDQDSTKFFDKKSGMWALNDWYNKRDIEKELREAPRDGIRGAERHRTEERQSARAAESVRATHFA